MRPFALSLWLAASVAMVALSALAASCEDGASDSGGPSVEDGGDTREDAWSPDSPDLPLPDAGSAEGRVYAHTNDTLFLYEPISGELKSVGKFDCANDVVDLAVDRTGTMFATTFDRFLSVDPFTAKCKQIAVATGAYYYPNALSFVPAGTVDPTKEALVGYAALFGEVDSLTYVQINTTTGEMTIRGDINASAAGPQYRCSGDLIALIQDGNRTYATVRLISAAAGTDLLAEIDPATGSVKRILGDTKQSNLFGFGYWAGRGYGFSDNGTIVEISMTNGSSKVVKVLTDDAGTAIPWNGAGVTTQAPIQ